MVSKNTIVIGGATGIGKAISEKLAKEGCNLFISYNSEKGKRGAEQLEKKFRDYGIEYHFKKLDVLDKDQIKDFFEEFKNLVGRLDIAVNNAGVSTMNHFTELTEKEWDFVMDVNIKGMFFCCQEEARIMMSQNNGKIINIASGASKKWAVFSAHYSASKYAVLGLTFTMAQELVKNNILVNAVCPGVTLTDMVKREWQWEADLRGMKKEEFVNNWRESIPLKKFAKPEYIANMVFFLSSDQSDYITGQAYNVDGGVENH